MLSSVKAVKAVGGRQLARATALEITVDRSNQHTVSARESQRELGRVVVRGLGAVEQEVRRSIRYAREQRVLVDPAA